MEGAYEVSLGNRDAGTRRRAAADPASFWAGEAARLSWFRGWDRVLDWDPPHARWFPGGMINASYNALDVHAAARASRPAILWEGEDGSSRAVTYGQLLEQAGRLAGALSSMGVAAGDRVAIYLPMVPEAVASMLACARIGAAHTVVFSGFSAAALRDRLADSGARVLVTADGGYRRGAAVGLKAIADEAVSGLGSVERVVVVRRTGEDVPMGPRDVEWDSLVGGRQAARAAEPLESSHPLFILYTSGTTGRPKGVVHGTGGYLTHVNSTFGWAFDPRESDVYFCTADVGWVTGHSYVAYGPLLRGATQVMYEGAPDWPRPGRMWDVVEKYGVTTLYTTPTALRMEMRRGDAALAGRDLGSLRLLGSVGEPISPEAWRWYFGSVGGGRCPVIDTWWQTETGGMMASALPGLETAPLKPGSATVAVPGVELDVLGGDGRPAAPGEKGHLVARGPWPGMMLTLWGDDARYRSAYWERYPGLYHAGDYAVRDADGYLWVLGRADDVLSVAGHRIGTAEVEGAIAAHAGVAEAAVCGVPDEVKGEAIAAFAVPREGADPARLRAEVAEAVRRGVGPVAAPSLVCIVPRLPKTRSGKIMRRLLRALASGGPAGDLTTIEDPGAVDDVRAALGSRR